MPRRPAPRTQVLLVDERDVAHLGFRELLASEPWVDSVLVAHSAIDALALARTHAPDVAVIGAAFPVTLALDLCERVSIESPRTRVLLLTAEPLSKRRARAAGAAGAVPSTWLGGEIAGAARTVALGMTLFAPETESPRRILTPRELEVLELIGAGATNREIADRLALSPNTVKEHASALYRKVSARNRAEAVVRGRELGLLR
jgi:two-component system response regulator DesR